ncbi:amino acid ABC transporter permease [Lacibacterium aquatile]|uniref:Amino acid ABC transporter permease n=1 Tax=Lacibacterium aquatile TaxID=1168082 RepID=A0ABW5DPE7_9PROT
MGYSFDFSSVLGYSAVLLKGILITVELTLIGGLLGVALGILCAWTRSFGPRWGRWIATAYIEMIRNTPFLVQLFFVFFGLPALGLRLSEMQAASLAMVLNLGAYSAEIIRAGIQATAKGQFEAGVSLGMTQLQTFRYVVLLPSLQRIWPALSSQIVIVMLGSAVVSQIAVEDLSFAANFIQSRNFRAFEMYFVTTALYLALAFLLRLILSRIGIHLFARRVAR